HALPLADAADPARRGYRVCHPDANGLSAPARTTPLLLALMARALAAFAPAEIGALQVQRDSVGWHPSICPPPPRSGSAAGTARIKDQNVPASCWRLWLTRHFHDHAVVPLWRAFQRIEHLAI